MRFFMFAFHLLVCRVSICASWITCQDLPNGYNYTDGVYVCLDGWFGSANAECIVSEESFGRWKDGSFLSQIG